MARYFIKAKRKNTNEKWTDWTNVDTYDEALRQVKHVFEVGFEGKLVPNSAVAKLWEILDEYENKVELTEQILDAGFCLRSITIPQLLYSLKAEIHNKATYPHDKGIDPYISVKVLDAIIQRIVGGNS